LTKLRLYVYEGDKKTVMKKVLWNKIIKKHECCFSLFAFVFYENICKSNIF